MAEVRHGPGPGVGAEGGPHRPPPPDPPRLGLDTLMSRLISRAREVQATQTRLRGLLRANGRITGELRLESVLVRTVQAARELIGSEHAAVGLLAPDGGLGEFAHTAGLAVPLDHLSAPLDRLFGSPDHPAGALTVPIMVGGRLGGHLHLAGRPGGFSREDEELTRALAGTAGGAVANARRYEAAQARGEWLQATERIGRFPGGPAAGASDPRPALQLLADHGRTAGRADLAMVAVTQPGGSVLRIAVAAGPGADTLPGLTFTAGGTLAYRVLTGGRPAVLIARNAAERAGIGPLPAHLGPALVVPLGGPGRPHGVLALARRSGRSPFTGDDARHAAAFAAQGPRPTDLEAAGR